jgi:hypothetical protein
MEYIEIRTIYEIEKVLYPISHACEAAKSFLEDLKSNKIDYDRTYYQGEVKNYFKYEVRCLKGYDHELVIKIKREDLKQFVEDFDLVPNDWTTKINVLL